MTSRPLARPNSTPFARSSDASVARAKGIGDDAAVHRHSARRLARRQRRQRHRGKTLRAGVVHAARDRLAAAVAAALSDLAAMAARPLGVLVAMVIPDAWRVDLDAITDGVADAVSNANTYVLGGNLSDGSELSITTTVLGSAFAPLAAQHRARSAIMCT